MGVLGFFTILIVAWCSCCLVQRKRGRHERMIADQNWQNDRAELLQYQKTMREGGFGMGSDMR